MVKVYTPRRIRERNRWLRSDGRPNFKNRIHESVREIEPFIRRNVKSVNESTPILRVCELMSSESTRIIPVLQPRGKIIGVITGMDIIDYLGGGSKHEVLLKRKLHLLYEALKLPSSAIMTSEVITVNVNSKVKDVLELMVAYSVGELPVVSKDGFEGIIGEDEILNFLAGKNIGINVRKVMSSDVITISSSSTLEQAMKLMVRTGIRRLPVLNDNTVVGVLSWKEPIDLIGTHRIFEILSSKSIDELKSLSINGLMRTNFLKVEPEDDIGFVAELMAKSRSGHALVVKGETLVGIITKRDIVFGFIAG